MRARRRQIASPSAKARQSVILDWREPYDSPTASSIRAMEEEDNHADALSPSSLRAAADDDPIRIDFVAQGFQFAIGGRRGRFDGIGEFQREAGGGLNLL